MQSFQKMKCWNKKKKKEEEEAADESLLARVPYTSADDPHADCPIWR